MHDRQPSAVLVPVGLERVQDHLLALDFGGDKLLLLTASARLAGS